MLNSTGTLTSLLTPTLAYSPVLVTALVVVFLLVCIAMILLILIQRPQGGGLSGAFGAGGGAGQTAFGTKTGDVLTMVTITIFVLFLVMAIILNFAARPSATALPDPAIDEVGAEVPVAPADAEDAQDAVQDALEENGDDVPEDGVTPPATDADPDADNPPESETDDGATEDDGGRP